MTEVLFLHWRDLRPAERAVLVALFIVIVGAALVPAVQQDPAYHRFADQRRWMSITNAADVLSYLAFLAVGLWSLARLSSGRGRKLSQASQAGLWCTALGLCLTALGSSWYHLEPSDARLVWDRVPMTLIFAGLLGMAIAQRLGERVGRVASPLSSNSAWQASRTGRRQETCHLIFCCNTADWSRSCWSCS